MLGASISSLALVLVLEGLDLQDAAFDLPPRVQRPLRRAARAIADIAELAEHVVAARLQDLEDLRERRPAVRRRRQAARSGPAPARRLHRRTSTRRR